MKLYYSSSSVTTRVVIIKNISRWFLDFLKKDFSRADIGSRHRNKWFSPDLNEGIRAEIYQRHLAFRDDYGMIDDEYRRGTSDGLFMCWGR